MHSSTRRITHTIGTVAAHAAFVATAIGFALAMPAIARAADLGPIVFPGWVFTTSNPDCTEAMSWHYQCGPTQWEPGDSYTGTFVATCQFLSSTGCPNSGEGIPVNNRKWTARDSLDFGHHVYTCLVEPTGSGRGNCPTGNAMYLQIVANEPQEPEEPDDEEPGGSILPPLDGMRKVCQLPVGVRTWTVSVPGGQSVTTESDSAPFELARQMMPPRDSGAGVLIQSSGYGIILWEQPDGVDYCPGEVPTAP